MIDVVNYSTNSPNYTATLESLVDIEQWMRTWAHLHAQGDWDHFGCPNGQNMYAYKPGQGRWNLFIWDHNIVMGNGSWGPGQNLIPSPSSYNGGDIGMGNIYSNARYLRSYYRALKEIANGPIGKRDSGLRALAQL